MVTFINVWFCVDVVFILDLYEVEGMTGTITLNKKQLNFLIHCIAKAMATNTNRPDVIIDKAELYMKKMLKKLGEEE